MNIKLSAILMATLLVAPAAFAAQPGAVATSASESNSNSAAVANANGGRAQQGQQQNQQTSSSAQTGPSQASVTDVTNSRNPQQAPEIIETPTNSTGPCLVGVGAAGSAPAFGLSLSFGKKDEGCEQRARAELFVALGHKDYALTYMCDVDPQMRKSVEENGDSCTRQPPAPPEPPAPSPVQQTEPVQPTPRAVQPPPPGERGDISDTKGVDQIGELINSAGAAGLRGPEA